MFNICFHKLGKVEKDGYQYCTKCGKAFSVPCDHTYELIKEIKNHGQFAVGVMDRVTLPHISFVSRCKKCGNIIVVVAD